MHCRNGEGVSRKQSLEAEDPIDQNCGFTYNVAQNFNPNTENAETEQPMNTRELIPGK